MEDVARVIEFPIATEQASRAGDWVPEATGRWVLPLDTPLPAMVTPWVRLVDYSLPGYVETEIPEGWVTRIAEWEQLLLRAAMQRPRPSRAPATWPASPAAWKHAHRPWSAPSPVHSDRWSGRWQAVGGLPVFVGAERVRAPANEALVPGQWLKLKIRLAGWSWDGHTSQLALVVEQVLVRQPWQEDVRAMAARAMESARTDRLIGLQEEKILSLLDISST